MMRHFLWLMTALVAGLLVAPSADAVPVYLRMDSRFPSGHYPRRQLEARMRKVQFQRWARIEIGEAANEKQYGWLPEEALLTPLSLAQEAVLTEDAPMRNERQMEALTPHVLKKDTRVLILEARGSWIRALPQPAPEQGGETWLLSESLKAVASAKPTKLYIPPGIAVFTLPGMYSRLQKRIKPSSIVAVIQEENGWYEIRQGSHAGFVRAADTITLNELGTDGVMVVRDEVDLRSAPLPYADFVRSLQAGRRAKLIDARSLRWGLTALPEIGEAWWPIASDFDDEKPVTTGDRFDTQDVFRRKIFDMASSPAIPSLKFVSAQGLFRTTDGSTWTRVPLFDDKNYPISIAGGGSVFVGPYVSDDHGETFEQWIRWDSLLATLRRFSRLPPGALQILEIKPQDTNGRRVIVKLNVGLKKPVHVFTEDQGLTWRSL